MEMIDGGKIDWSKRERDKKEGDGDGEKGKGDGERGIIGNLERN